MHKKSQKESTLTTLMSRVGVQLYLKPAHLLHSRWMLSSWEHVDICILLAYFLPLGTL